MGFLVYAVLGKMSESDFWRDHVSLLKQFGKVKRLEDIMDNGTPDVIFVLHWFKEPPRMGFLELKMLPKWPTRPDTKVRLPHFTIDQATFLKSWGEAGGNTFLLAQIANEFLLFSWRVVGQIYEGVRQTEMISLASVHGRGLFPLAKVLKCLTHSI